MDSPLKGKILVATPQLLDPNFARSLVLIVQHNEEGAMGLVLNRPLETTVAQAWMQVSSVPYPNEDPLFQGGPCEGPLMVVHKDAKRGQVNIGIGAYLSSDADVVRELVSDGLEPIKFFVGFSGWDASQLEREVKQGAWLIAPIEVEQVFSTPAELWDELIKESRGTLRPAVDPKRIPRDPSVN